jgi:4'-phosphopantetheinyl transferase
MPATAQDAWAPGPLHPPLADGAVHVWRADLTAVGEGLGELLCSEERARAERFLGERDRQLWTRSRGVLRALLGRYLRQDPSSLRFATGPHGKPALVEDARQAPAAAEPSAARSPRLSFNMSHSRQLALYAFSEAGAVGVDVEVARQPSDEVAIAARVFGAAVARRLERLDPAARQREFLRAWVRHEAELKCLGVGIGRASAGGADAGTGEPGLWVAELDVGPTAAAAVAAERPAGELRCWDWAPGAC